MIEVIIAIAILSILFGLGLFLSMDFYRAYLFRYERNLAVSLLEKSRSRAMANIGQLPHGVRFDLGTSEYIMFYGSVEERIQASKAVTIDWPNDVVFDQLSGDCTTCSPTLDITISHNARTAIITVNSEGTVLW